MHVPEMILFWTASVNTLHGTTLMGSVNGECKLTIEWDCKFHDFLVTLG